MHIVSNVEGAQRWHDPRWLRASFPAGTLTVRKIRAMEIIDELEPVSVGSMAAPWVYLNSRATWTWPLPFAPAVIARTRTCTCKPGAGVVADSVPNWEWRETEAKARAVVRAAGRWSNKGF